jgi:hypothetical protein
MSPAYWEIQNSPMEHKGVIEIDQNVEERESCNTTDSLVSPHIVTDAVIYNMYTY